jgi:hypothetical protein
MSVLERVALRSSVSREQLLSNQFNINSRNNSHSVLVSDELGQPLSVRQSDSVKQLSSLAPLLPPASLLESESSNSQDKVLQLLKLRQQQQQNQRAQQAQQAQQAQANQLQLPTQQHTSANLTPRQLAQQVKPASSPPTVATVKSVHQQMSPPTIHVSPAHQSNSSASNQKNLSIMVSPVDALSASPSGLSHFSINI